MPEGVKFHDGSPVDGEAVAISINWLWSDENNYSVREMMGPQISAEPVDATTVAVITAAPDPLLPRRIYLGGVTSGKQILENPAGHDLHPIGTGPYVFAERKQGQMLPSVATGFHDGISQYPCDPMGAKAIVDDLKASGTEIPSIHIATRLGSTPRNGEMVEAMGAMLTFIGVPNTVAVEEPGVFNPWVTTKPDPSRSSAWLHVQANPLLDYGATFGAHFSCGGIVSVFCDPDFDARVAVAASLVGQERHEALKALVKQGHDRYVVAPVGLLQRACGVPEGFEWKFGLDHRMVAVNMRLN